MSKSKVWLWIILVVIAIVAVVFIFTSSSKTPENKDNNTMKQSVSFEVLNVIPEVQIQFPEEIVINSTPDWNQYFTGTPPVNMDDYTIIGYNMGQKPNSGYYIEVKDVIEKQDTVLIKADTVSPGENCLTLQVISYPTTYIAIPKTQKPVVWEFTSVIDECE